MHQQPRGQRLPPPPLLLPPLLLPLLVSPPLPLLQAPACVPVAGPRYVEPFPLLPTSVPIVGVTMGICSVLIIDG